MRSWVLFSTFLAALASSTWLSAVEAAACAEICYTTDLTGFGPGGTAGCSCTGSGATRSGPGSCSCGQCYSQTNGAVIGYAINSDGTCTYGTDCGDCTYSSDASGSSTTSSGSSTTSTTSSKSTTGSSSSTTTTTDTTSSASKTSTTTTATSSSSSTDNAGNAGSTATSDTTSDNGLKTWQIALIICCGVLVFTVAVVSVLSCYCKARNRLYENEDEQADASYYQQQYPRQRQDIVGSGAVPTPTLFSQAPTSARSHARSGSSGSFTNELKPMYANSANSGSTDRLGVGLGLAPVHMRNSSGDLAGMAAGSYSNERIMSGSYSNERILSGSYPTDRRPSSGNRSVGRRPSDQYNTARDRDSLAVEL